MNSLHNYLFHDLLDKSFPEKTDISVFSMWQNIVGTVIALVIKYMDEKDGIDKTSDIQATDASTTVSCKLFSDTASRHLCDLRRRELNARGIFSCEGCMAINNDNSNNSI